MKNAFALVFLALFTALQGFAGEPFTFGAEWEFVHPSITHDWEKGGDIEAGQAKILYMENIKKICASLGCTVKQEYGKHSMRFIGSEHRELGMDYRVTFPDGWWFEISHDPQCVEIKTKPSTNQELKERANIINDVIFNSGKDIGFSVPPRDSAHFNIGFMRAFENNGDLFLKFFTDYQNRPELSMGALGHDIYNAPPLSIMPNKMRQALQKIVLDHKAEPMTAKRLALRIEKEVYLEPYAKSWGGPHHYQLIGLKHINKTLLDDILENDRPFELRGIWNQQNVEQFMLLGELFEARINYLKTVTTPITYTETRVSKATALELAASFYNYVTETGLEFERFKVLMPLELQVIDSERVINKAQKMKLEFEEKIQYQQNLMNPKSCHNLFAS